ncbi:hypothetical protein ILP86_00860 [Microbacterium sp. R1]|uniref:hypothetical protein n=1 Tax=Microbacterium sp. R1 TaxID=322686 RepID=UPI0011C96E8E|nr:MULTISPECIES: hypothetical protein [Terrabacteria group]MBE7952862.1 hypothetical protein [Microbacterium sp. R1]TXF80622.1 hypothetical protein FTX54_16440 [Alkalicoccus halolimnae]
MISRSGDRVPAGVSGEAGRGTVGTDAPTTSNRSDDLAVALFSPVLWAVAIGYAVAGVTLVYVACVLAPWGLLLLILAIGALAAAVLCGFVAFGISRLEEDPA